MAIYSNKVKLENGTDLILRNAEESDAEQMIAYLNIIGGESDNLLFGKGCFRLNVEQEREYLKNMKEEKDSLMLLGLIDNKIASVAQISCPNRDRISHNGEIAISVMKEYWHIGIGTYQMKNLIEFAKSVNIRNINLGVRHVNENAIKLYEKMGFKKVGVHKNFFNINGNFYDEILMDLYLY